MNYSVVIVAAGKGKRADLGYNKVLYEMKDGRTVLEKAAGLFLDDEDCKEVIIVTDEGTPVPDHPKVKRTIGGKERKDSVYNGLSLVSFEYVFIHDAARPFLSEKALKEVKEAVIEKKAVILAKRSTDTVKIVKDGKIEKTLDRNTVYLAETPQAFETELLQKAYEICGEDVTDDASLLEKAGIPVYIVENDTPNPKLTRQEDFEGL